ncbi:MAG TPA: hypothetical protein VGP63_21345 [Planctomycetaceae bacterium]|nr:hypothetical protein [Planctomycetaceae bacterium]
MANNRYANAARRKRQEKARKPRKISSLPPPEPPTPLPQPSQLAELIDNLNWALGAIRKVAESEKGRRILDRFVRLADSACIVDGLTLDSEGWAALLNLANGRSFSALKNRRGVQSRKPGQTLMFSAADLLRASDGVKSRARSKRS